MGTSTMERSAIPGKETILGNSRFAAADTAEPDPHYLGVDRCRKVMDIASFGPPGVSDKSGHCPVHRQEHGGRKAIPDVAQVSPRKHTLATTPHPPNSSTSDSSICRRPDYVSATRVWYIRGYRISPGHGTRLTGHPYSVPS